jgi:hypothetical protein
MLSALRVPEVQRSSAAKLIAAEAGRFACQLRQLDGFDCPAVDTVYPARMPSASKRLSINLELLWSSFKRYVIEVVNIQRSFCPGIQISTPELMPAEAAFAGRSIRPSPLQ